MGIKTNKNKYKNNLFDLYIYILYSNTFTLIYNFNR